MSRQDRLREYCDATKDVSAIWGVDDCTQWAANWVEKETGVIIPRIKYSSKIEALQLIKDAGSLYDIWDNALPFFQTSNPNSGDVCIVKTLRFGDIGAIWTRFGMVAWRAEKGYVLLEGREKVIVASWQIP